MVSFPPLVGSHSHLYPAGLATFLSSFWENTYCSSAKEDQDKQQVLRGPGNRGSPEDSSAAWFLKQGISRTAGQCCHGHFYSMALAIL